MLRLLSTRLRLRQLLPRVSLCITACASMPPYGAAAPSGIPDAVTGYSLVMPAQAPSIAQGFKGSLNDAGATAHQGIDIVAATGVAVIAAAPGVIGEVSRDPLSGRRIVIDHGTDNSGMRYSTWYFHLNDQRVEIGDRVERGQPSAALVPAACWRRIPTCISSYTAAPVLGVH